MGRKGHPLAARIKKMMQTDDDVGKIAQATPIMISRAMELFLQRLCKSASDVAAARKAKTLTCSHVKAYINSDELMDFLKDYVDKAPDLPPEGEPEAPKPKRQRISEPKPSAPKGEGKAKASREPSGAAAAAVPVASAAEDACDVAAEASDEPGPSDREKLQPPGAAVAPALQQVKQKHKSSSPVIATQQKLGAGGLGSHPFLAARTFGNKAAAGFTKPDSKRVKQEVKQEALHQEQAELLPAAGAVAAAQQLDSAETAPMQEPSLPAQEQLQQQLDQEASVGADVAPPLLPGVSLQVLTGLATHPQHTSHMQEDDYDDDYDS